MPSIVDLAKLSNAVYPPVETTVTVVGPELLVSSPPVGQNSPQTCLLEQVNACGTVLKTWVRKDFCNIWGFQAGLYTCGDQRVIAFRGTDGLLDGLLADLVDDAAIFAGAKPPQLLAAFETVAGWGFSGNTYLTGHSLGGALAILAACRFKIPAVTFNAPGVSDICVQVAAQTNGLLQVLAEVSRCISNSRVRNLRIEGDLVSSFFITGLQAGGNVQSYSAASCGFDALCRHGMATCLAEMSKSNENYQDLNL